MTVYFDDESIPSMLADWGNVITATPDGGQPVTGPCQFNESDELKLDSANSAPTVMRVVRAFVQTTQFGFLEGGATCSIDGVTYEVWKRMLEGDGALSQLLLRVA